MTEAIAFVCRHNASGEEHAATLEVVNHRTRAKHDTYRYALCARCLMQVLHLSSYLRGEEDLPMVIIRLLALDA
jgi:hypothetical protein